MNVDDKVNRNRITMLARKRKRYAFARSLGLTADQSSAVSAWSEAMIKAFAQERDHKSRAG